MSVRLATWNIQRGGWRRRDAIAAVLRRIDADIAVLQEASDPGTVRTLVDATASRAVIQAPGRSVAVLCRDAPVHLGYRSIGTRRLVADIRLASGVRVLGVHLSAGLSRSGERRRERELDGLLALAAEPPGNDLTIIIGDLNAVSPHDTPSVARMPRWIRLLLRVDGGLGTTVVERILAEGFVDAFRLLHPRACGDTIPAAAPLVRLDYVMLGAGLAGHLRACRVGLSDPTAVATAPAALVTASDHLPVIADLDLPADVRASGPTRWPLAGPADQPVAVGRASPAEPSHPIRDPVVGVAQLREAGLHDDDSSVEEPGV